MRLPGSLMRYLGLKAGVFSTWKGIAATWRVLSRRINLNLVPQKQADFLAGPGGAAFRGPGVSEAALLEFIRDRNASARNALELLLSHGSSDPHMAYRTQSREHAYKFLSSLQKLDPDVARRLAAPAMRNRILNLLILCFPGPAEGMISMETLAKLTAPTRDIDGTLPSISELLADPVRGLWDNDPVGPAVLTPTSTVMMSDPSWVEIGDHVVLSLVARTAPAHPLDGTAAWFLMLDKRTGELRVAVLGAGTHPMSIVDALNIPTARGVFEAMAETFKHTVEAVDIVAATKPPTLDEIDSFARKDPELAVARQLARTLDMGGYLPRAIRLLFGSGDAGSPPTVPPTDDGGGDDENFVLDYDPALDPRVEDVVDAANDDPGALDGVTLHDDGKTLAQVVGDKPLEQWVEAARAGTEAREVLEMVRDQELHAEPVSEPPPPPPGGDGQGGDPPGGDPRDPDHDRPGRHDRVA